MFVNRRRLKRRLKRYLILTVLGVVVLFLVNNFFLNNISSNSEKLVTPNSSATQALSISGSPNPQVSNSLKEAISKALEGTHGTYGIVVKSLKTGETYYTNEHKAFEPGSLYKLWIMATAYKQIQDGTLKEDEILSEDVDTLNKKFYVDPDLAELTEGTITLSVSDALNQMITISHNYASLLLTERLKLSSVSAYLKDNGFNESTVGTNGEDPISTPSDTALFFEKLYKNQLANTQYTNKMLDLLKKQQKNEKLPQYLPEGTIVAHKTGEIGYFTHDAGIIYQDKGDYIIVVLSESDSPPGAEDRISGISEAVYQYFHGAMPK